MLHHLAPDDLAALMAHPKAVRRLQVIQPAQIGAAYEAHRTCVVVKKIHNASHATGPGVAYEEEWLSTADQVGILGRRDIDVWDDAPRGWFSHRVPGRFCVYVCGPLRGTINNEVCLCFRFSAYRFVILTRVFDFYACRHRTSCAFAGNLIATPPAADSARSRTFPTRWKCADTER